MALLGAYMFVYKFFSNEVAIFETHRKEFIPLIKFRQEMLKKA